MRRGATRLLWIALCGGNALVLDALGCSGDDGTATASEAGVDAADGSFVDAPPDARDASSDAPRRACPNDLSAFDAAWHPPTPFYQARCTHAQIDGFLAACLAVTATSATCAAFRAGSGADCANCVASAPTDPTYGPVVLRGSGATLELSGCIANADRSDAGAACAAAYQKADECDWYACDNCDYQCPDPTAIGCGLPCEVAAAYSVCVQFTDAASCANGYASLPVEAGSDAADAGLAAHRGRSGIGRYCEYRCPADGSNVAIRKESPDGALDCDNPDNIPY
jgi:hypothetical protein